MSEVTHPSEGIYLSKFMAGMLSTILGVALVGAFANLWQLNSSAILFNNHLTEIGKGTASLPGAVSRNEWILERNNNNSKYEALSAQIGALTEKVDQLNEKVK